MHVRKQNGQYVKPAITRAEEKQPSVEITPAANVVTETANEENEESVVSFGESIFWKRPAHDQVIFCLRAPVNMNDFIPILAEKGWLKDKTYTVDFCEASKVFDTVGFYLNLPLTVAETNFIDNVLMQLMRYSHEVPRFAGARDYFVGLNYQSHYYAKVTKNPVKEVFSDNITTTVAWASMCLPGFTEERMQMDTIMAYLSSIEVRKNNAPATFRMFSVNAKPFVPKLQNANNTFAHAQFVRR